MLIKLTNHKDVNNRKLKLEKVVKRLLISLYKNISKDHSKVIKQYGNIVNKTTFINEHLPDLKSILKAIYRKTFNEFGYDARKAINNITNTINFDIKKTEPKDIYNDYNIESLKVINDKTDEHSNYIAETLYTKSLFYINKVNDNYTNDVANLTDRINKLSNQLAALSNKTKNAINKGKISKIKKELKEAQDNLDTALSNKNEYIANQFESLFNENVVEQLAELESVSEVGYAESTARQLELSLLATSGIVLEAQKKTIDFATAFIKEWSSTLDSKTRTTHAHAHGQQKKVNERFEVQNPRNGNIEYGLVPRDDNFSLENKINCRCIVIIYMNF